MRLFEQCRPWVSTLLLLTSPLLFTGCATRGVWTPLASTEAFSVNKEAVDTPSKTYALNHDWQFRDWVVKRGATVTFRSDGVGTISGRVFTTSYAKRQELRLQVLQYGRDGHLLFAAPPADLGVAIEARTATRDYPFDVNFGFDRRQYPFITRAQFVARVRMDDPRLERSERRRGLNPGVPPQVIPVSP